jgi:hypothetical protein
MLIVHVDVRLVASEFSKLDLGLTRWWVNQGGLEVFRVFSKVGFIGYTPRCSLGKTLNTQK